MLSFEVRSAFRDTLSLHVHRLYAIMSSDFSTLLVELFKRREDDKDFLPSYKFNLCSGNSTAIGKTNHT